MYELESGHAAPRSQEQSARSRVRSYTAAAIAALVAAGTLGDTMGWPWWWPVLAGLLLGTALTYYLYQDGRRRGVLVFAASSTAAASCWLAWAYACPLVTSKAIYVGPFLALAIGGLALAILGQVATTSEIKEIRVERAQVVATQAAEQAAAASTPQALAVRYELDLCQRWAQRFQDVSSGARKLVPRIYGARPWAGESADYGFDLYCQLPGKGTTFALVQGLQDALEVDAHVSGESVFGVEVHPGANKSLFKVSVATADAMAREWEFPLAELVAGGPRTIDDGVTLGRHPDGTIPTIFLRSATPLVSGRKGTGKSNLMHACVGGLCFCVDTINVVVDISKRGSFGAPWARSYILGEVSEPGVAWIAGTWDEARRMTGFFLHLLQQRQANPEYSALKFRVNDDKLPVAPGRPKVVIWVDEFAEVGGITNKPKDPEVARNLLQIIRVGREMAIDVAICGLRVTSETIPQEATVQASIKLATRMESAGEMAQVFGWERPLSQEDIPYPGCGYWAQDDGTSVGSVPRRLRSWRMKPQMIDKVVRATAQYRSSLDVDLCEPAWREQWEGRWDRSVPDVFPDLAATWAARRQVDRVDTSARPTVHLSTTARPVELSTSTTPRVDTQGPPEGGQGGDVVGTPELEPALAMAQGMASVESSLARARELLAAQQADQPAPDDVERQFRETVVGGGAVAPENPWGQPPPAPDAAEQGRRTLAATREAQGVMLRVLHDAGPSGCSFDHVNETMEQLGYATPNSTLYRWLKNYSSGYDQFMSPDFAT